MKKLREILNHDLSARAFWLGAALLCLVRIGLTRFQMFYTWVGGAPLDDELMFRAANAITNGQWLGKYDYLTLSKSMFFPVWLALLNLLHIPYLLGGALLWCAAAMLAAIPVERDGRTDTLLQVSVEAVGAGIPEAVPLPPECAGRRCGSRR